MPAYNLSCTSCGSEENIFLSINEFLKIRDSPNPCEKCNKGLMKKTFNNSNVMSNISRSAEEIVVEVREEARILADKIRSGDMNLAANIYGDEVNKLKQS